MIQDMPTRGEDSGVPVHVRAFSAWLYKLKKSNDMGQM